MSEPLIVIEETIIDPTTGESITVRAGTDDELERKWRARLGPDGDSGTPE
jgi:hypothetical protein